jgi:hypothetical protein
MGNEHIRSAGTQFTPRGAIQGVVVIDSATGLPNSAENPIYTQLTDGSINIGTVNGELEVALSHKDNDPDIGDVHDSVRIGDGTEELAINSDGSINVAITGGSSLATTAGNIIVDIPLAGAADRVQLPAHACKSLSIQFKAGTGKIFIGGSTVTNALGANEGVDLDPGDTFGPVEISNTNAIYVATSDVGNDVKVFWTV